MSKYTEDFKTKVGVEATKGELSLKALGEKYGVHPTLVRNWRIKYGQQALDEMKDASNAFTVVTVNTYRLCDRNGVKDPSALSEEQSTKFCAAVAQEMTTAFSNNIDEDINRLFVKVTSDGSSAILPISKYLESPSIIESIITEDEAVFFISELDGMDWASGIIMISDELETSLTIIGPHSDYDNRIVKQGYDCGDLDTGIVEAPDELETYASESFESIYESYFD